MDVNDYSKDSYDLLIFKFLNHSSNAITYGILAVGVFAAAIFNTTTLYDSEVLNWGTSTFIMLLMSTTAGLIWWRQSVNRQDYKAILKILINDDNGETSSSKAEKVMESIRQHKQTILERLRLVRLSLTLMTTLYLILISFTLSAAILDPEIKLFDPTNIVFYSIGGLSIAGLIIVSLIVNSKYRKDLTKENYMLSSSSSESSG